MELLGHRRILAMEAGILLDAMRKSISRIIIDILTLYSEGTTGRALPNGVTTTGGSSKMTVDLCTQACQAAGYVLAGVEYAQECCKCSFGYSIPRSWS